ncbi:MAG: xylose isomerase [Christensenellaceae bacterium]
MTEYFKNVPQVKYEGASSKNPFAFKFYNPDEKIMGKTMRETLKFTASYWHTFASDIHDMFGDGTIDRAYGETDAMAVAKAKAHAAFEFLNKMGIDYYCFHDRDVAPEGKTLAQSNENLDEIVDLLKKLQDENGKKVLWGTANLFGNPRYMHGAATSCNADVYAYAAAQVKKAIECTMKLNGMGYTFWGGREGYETLLNTNMSLELDNMARFLRMQIDAARAKGYKGDFYIEPKPKEPTKHQYDFDTSTCLAFLRKYNLDKDMKMNLEANHATLAQHTFQHEIRVARDNGVFGSIDANMGDTLLGWDTDQFPTNVYDTALAAYEIIKAGGFTNGGYNFDAKVRRPSYKFEDIAMSYIAGMDTIALGYKMAAAMIEDGRIDAFVEERYASYQSGIGAQIVSGKATLDELEKYALNMGEVTTNISGKQEYLESILNSILFQGI